MAFDDAAPPPPSQRPHPVAFDVEYPERHSRWLIFVKWLLVIPQWIIIYLLLQVVALLSLVAWFAILFTGRYPQSMHTFSVGCLRWSANVNAYLALLRDEYPPFSFDAGEYALDFDIPYPERQSRWRLFIRWFAVIPNFIVLWFVQSGCFSRRLSRGGRSCSRVTTRADFSASRLACTGGRIASPRTAIFCETSIRHTAPLPTRALATKLCRPSSDFR